MNEDQIIERGVAANALLTDERFLSFVNETSSLILESIGNTIPQDTEGREKLYFQFNGLQDVIGTMRSYVDAAKAILESREKPKEELD